MSVFDRYAPFIQDFIYSHEWESLRAVQVAQLDAVAAVPCASGKGADLAVRLQPVVELRAPAAASACGAHGRGRVRRPADGSAEEESPFIRFHFSAPLGLPLPAPCRGGRCA